MIFLPALRFLTRPLPPGFFAARFLAAVILPPLLFFAIIKSPPFTSMLTVYHKLKTLARYIWVFSKINEVQIEVFGVHDISVCCKYSGSTRVRCSEILNSTIYCFHFFATMVAWRFWFNQADRRGRPTFLSSPLSSGLCIPPTWHPIRVLK